MGLISVSDVRDRLRKQSQPIHPLDALEPAQIAAKLIDAGYFPRTAADAAEIAFAVAATLAASYALAAKGVTAVTLPSSTVPQYIAALDDGADGTPADEMVGLAWATNSSTGYANIVQYAGGSSQLSAIPNAATSKAKAVSTDYRAAIRVKLNSTIISFDGATQSTDTGCNVPAVTQLVVGNRDDGTRGWAGTIHRIVFVNAEIDATALNGLLA